MERAFGTVTNRKVASFLVESGLYFILVVSFFLKIRVFDYRDEHLVWPVMWIKYLDGIDIVLVLSVLAVASPFFTLVKKFRLAGQVFTWLSIFFLLAISYSNGKVYHSVVAWLIFLPILLVCNRYVSTPYAAHFAFFCVSTSYLNAGIWKLRTLVPYLWNTHDFEIFPHILKEHIAYAAIERMRDPGPISNLILSHDFLSGLFWAIAILGELIVVLILLFRKQAYLFALYIFAFHFSVYVIMQINFLTSMSLNLSLCVYFYLVRDQLDNSFDKGT